MNNLKLRLHPDPFLLRPSTPVKEVRENHVKTAIRMHELMKVLGGLGLSAPQVGVPYSVVVINTLGYENGIKLTMFNPEIEHLSEELHEFREGCLSFPDEFIDSKRPATCIVRYVDSQNNQCVKTLHGISSVCAQHEIDHINGILFKS